jgi:hypothetical protein
MFKNKFMFKPYYKKNIRGDGERKFGKMIEYSFRPEKIKLGKIMYKRNSFLDYLTSQNIILYLNSSPFINKIRVVNHIDCV